MQESTFQMFLSKAVRIGESMGTMTETSGIDGMIHESTVKTIVQHGARMYV
jgi:hypothetical protein